METKEHFEILLEHMDSKFDLVLESHAGLNKKIEDLRQEVREFRQENEFEHREFSKVLANLRQETKDIRQDVKSFREQNEAEHQEMRQQNSAEHKEIRADIKTSGKGWQQEAAGLTRRVSRLEAARI